MGPDPLSERAERLLALSAAELDAYLEQHADDPGIWDALREILDARGRAAPPVAFAPVGPRIQGFRLERELGQGGMGTVYLAQQESVPRLAALKVIRANRADAGHVERFRREFEAIGSLSHPNVAAVYEAGTTPDGQPWFAMEYVAGPWLTEFVARHGLGLEARLWLFVDVCRGVQHAHQNGVFHRDLKPSNVLVAGTADDPMPKLIDFGLAGFEDEQRRSASLSADHRALVGSLGYMSPEQAGLGPRVDSRCDVYSLGVILYELLTGVRPLPDEADGDVDWEALPGLIQSREPTPPSRRLRRLLRGGESSIAGSDPGFARRLAGDLDRITMHALEKRPDDRYQTAKEFADDVVRFLHGEPVMARERTPSYLLRKFVRRNPGVAVAGVILAAVALAAGVTIAVLAGEARAAAAVARAELERFDAFGMVSGLRTLRDRERRTPPPARPAAVPTLTAWLDALDVADASRERLVAVRAEVDASLTTAAPGVGATTLDARRELVAAIDAGLGLLDGELVALRRNVVARRAWAGTVTERTVASRAADWAAARARVAADPRFAGLSLDPLVGFVPLGPNAVGLEELAMPLPGCSEPRRDPASGELVRQPDACPVFVLLPPVDHVVGSQRDDPDGRRYDPWWMPSELALEVEPIPIPALLASKYEITFWQQQCMDGVARLDRLSAAVEGIEVGLDTAAHSLPLDDMEYAAAAWGLTMPQLDWLDHAARGGTDTPWWTGVEPRSLLGAENIADLRLTEAGAADDEGVADWDDGHLYVARVGSLRANPFGLHDVLGNVREPAVFDHDGERASYMSVAGSWHQGWRRARVNQKVRIGGAPNESLGWRPFAIVDAP